MQKLEELVTTEKEEGKKKQLIDERTISIILKVLEHSLKEHFWYSFW